VDDKGGRVRVSSVVDADSNAVVSCRDTYGRSRIVAAAFANGIAGVQWCDKDRKPRIGAKTIGDGSVTYPTPFGKWLGAHSLRALRSTIVASGRGLHGGNAALSPGTSGACWGPSVQRSFLRASG
jgi:hypothetical protein